LAEEQHVKRKLNTWEISAAASVFVLGAYMAAQGFDYTVGSLNHMGAGFFPVVVGLLLVFFGIAIFLEVRYRQTPPPDIPVRPLAALTAGLIAFAVLIEPAGLVPATFFLVLIAAFGDETMGVLRALITAFAIAVLGYLVFVVGFRLTLDPFWW